MPYGRWCDINLMHGLLESLASQLDFFSCFRFWPLFLAPTWCGCHGINWVVNINWFLMAIRFCDGFFSGLLSVPFLTLVLVIHRAYITITHVANYERSGLWSEASIPPKPMAQLPPLFLLPSLSPSPLPFPLFPSPPFPSPWSGGVQGFFPGKFWNFTLL